MAHLFFLQKDAIKSENVEHYFGRNLNLTEFY